MTDEGNGESADLPPAPPIRVVVLDDDAPSRRRLATLLGRHDDAEMVGQYGDVQGAAEAIGKLRPDLLFLEIELSGADGFALLERLRSDRPCVVVVTSRSEHARRAFDAEAVDYLLKPLDPDRFDQALGRAMKWIRYRRQDGLIRRLAEVSGPGNDGRAEGCDRGAKGREAEGPSSLRPLRKLVVSDRGRKLLVDVEEVDWVEAVDYYARIHAGSKAHLIRKPLRWLERHLDPGRFVRIHRSSIVNVDRVREIVPRSGTGHEVRLVDGTGLRLSATRRRQLERLLGQSI